MSSLDLLSAFYVCDLEILIWAAGPDRRVADVWRKFRFRPQKLGLFFQRGVGGALGPLIEALEEATEMALKTARRRMDVLGFALLIASGLVLGGVGRAGSSDSMPQPFTVQDALAGDWRETSSRERDSSRHPAETLEFFGLEPGMTLVEVSPGGGWYTKILAPFASRTGGQYFAAGFSPEDPREYAQKSRRRFQKRYVDQEAVYGPIEVTVLGDSEKGVAPAGTADLIVTFRNVHNWVPAGTAEENFQGFYRALRPGGILGVVDHRLPPSMEADADLSSGYIHQSTVVELAEQAGFVLEAESEINSNPADTADHPYGVWTLRPTSLSAPYGAAADPAFDRGAYDAIGESDRFTLRFRKPETS